MKQINLIIVHYHTFALLSRQLNLLVNNKSTNLIADCSQNKRGNFLNFEIDYQITVIDNNSLKMAEKKFLIDQFNSVSFIFNSTNKGFGSAVNLGNKNSQAEWLLILNPDVLLTVDDLNLLYQQANNIKFEACSPQPLSENYHKPLPSFWSLLIEFTFWHYFIPLSIFKNFTLTGGCLLIKKNIFDQLGGFDENFFLWFEDSDLTKRLKDRGLKIGFVEVEVKHLGGSSLKLLSNHKRRTIFFSSMVLYTKKHLSIFSQLLAKYLQWKFIERENKD